jgi:uncharacterized protein
MSDLPPRPDLLTTGAAGGDGGPPGRRQPLSVPWSPVEAAPVFLLALLLTAIIGVPLGALFQSCGALFSIGLLAGDLAFVLAVVLWVKLVNHSPLSALGKPRRPLRDALAGMGVGVAMLIVGGMVLVATQVAAEAILSRPAQQPQQLAGCVRGIYLVAAAPMVVLGAPIAEETFFRGFLYQGLRRRLRVAPAVAASSVLFGVVHFAGLSFLLLVPALVVVGVGLALTFEWRRSLLAAIVAHATFNLAGFIAIAMGRT